MTNNAENEWKRIQIELAKLQTDIQIFLALSLTLVAAAGAFLIAETQSIGYNNNLFEWLSIAFATIAIIVLIPMVSVRREMEKIKV